MATGAYGSLLKRGTQVASHEHSGVIGNNNAILWTAVTEGTAGDLVNFHLVDPGGTLPLVVTVVGVAIHVQLATLVGAITSTAAEVIAAVKAHTAASALVTVGNDGASTGAGVMVAQAETFLGAGNNTLVYTAVAECRNITGPNLTLGTTETTHHLSTGQYREYISTVLDAGEISCELNFLPTNATQDQIYGLIKDVKHRTLRAFQLVLTDTAGTTWSFSAFVTAFGGAQAVDGKLTANVTLKISGQPTLA